MPAASAPTATTTRAVEPPAWTAQLIGAFALDDGRQRLTRLPSRAVTMLLARLAMWPERAHPREELVELLWPGVAASVGRNRLRQALSVLRTVLEPPGRALWPVIVSDRLTLQAAAGALDSDVARLRRAAQAAGSSIDTATRSAAAALVASGAELLPGWADEWVIDERRQVASWLHKLALHKPADAQAIDPKPTPTSTVPVAPTAPVRLPSYLTRPIGTEQPARAIAAQLGATRLVLLRGPGGVGKTRLAIEAARHVAAAGAAGDSAATPFELIVFVQLAGCTTRAQALDAIALALRADEGRGSDDAPIVRALAVRRTLLVLDNLEHLIDELRADLARWLAELPTLHLLATARTVLGIDGELDWPVSPLPLPPQPDADPTAWQAWAANPAVELFIDRARAARADFHLN